MPERMSCVFLRLMIKYLYIACSMVIISRKAGSDTDAACGWRKNPCGVFDVTPGKAGWR